MGKHDDAHKYRHGRNDFHRRGDYIVEHVVEDKSSKRECELKNSSYCRGDIFEPTIIEAITEEVRDKNEKEDIYWAWANLCHYFSYAYHLTRCENYDPAEYTSKE